MKIGDWIIGMIAAFGVIWLFTHLTSRFFK